MRGLGSGQTPSLFIVWLLALLLVRTGLVGLRSHDNTPSPQVERLSHGCLAAHGAHPRHDPAASALAAPPQTLATVAAVKKYEVATSRVAYASCATGAS